MKFRKITQEIIDAFIEVGLLSPIVILLNDIESFVFRTLFILFVVFPLYSVLDILNLIIFGNQSIGMKITGLIYVDINHKKATRKHVLKGILLYPSWIRKNFVNHITGVEYKEWEVYHTGIQMVLKKDCKDE